MNLLVGELYYRITNPTVYMIVKAKSSELILIEHHTGIVSDYTVEQFVKFLATYGYDYKKSDNIQLHKLLYKEKL